MKSSYQTPRSNNTSRLNKKSTYIQYVAWLLYDKSVVYIFIRLVAYYSIIIYVDIAIFVNITSYRNRKCDIETSLVQIRCMLHTIKHRSARTAAANNNTSAKTDATWCMCKRR